MSAHRDFGLSFEFFPPKSLEASFNLWNAVETLQALNPDFVSITYGAGGTTRDLTTSAVGVITKNYGLEVAGHLTCVEASREETLGVARAYAAKGAKRIVALRGDPPAGQDRFTAHPEGFQSSLELVKALTGIRGLDVIVAAHPHPHPEAESAKADIDFLKAKFDAGASAAITQFFFETEDFLRFRDACAKAGIDKPIIPGILPIENWTKIRNFAERCQVPIPLWMDQGFGHALDDDQARLFATSLCAEMCDDLLAEGAQALHFYTLNDPTLTVDVCRAMGRTSRQPTLHSAVSA